MPCAGSVSKNKMRKLHKKLRQELIAGTADKHLPKETPPPKVKTP